MKKFLAFFLLLLLPAFAEASSYGLYTPQNYGQNFNPESGEMLLFILDLSNSMNEPLENESKYNLMLKTMMKILPKISSDTKVGLRVYGHKTGLTPVEACRATALISPISANNTENIGYSLQNENRAE